MPGEEVECWSEVRSRGQVQTKTRQVHWSIREEEQDWAELSDLIETSDEEADLSENIGEDDCCDGVVVDGAFADEWEEGSIDCVFSNCLQNPERRILTCVWTEYSYLEAPIMLDRAADQVARITPLNTNGFQKVNLETTDDVVQEWDDEPEQEDAVIVQESLVAGESSQQRDDHEDDEGGEAGWECSPGDVLAWILEVSWQIGSCHDTSHSGEQDSEHCEEVHLAPRVLAVLAVVWIQVALPETVDGWEVGVGETREVGVDYLRGVGGQGDIVGDIIGLVQEEWSYHSSTTNSNLELILLVKINDILLGNVNKMVWKCIKNEDIFPYRIHLQLSIFQD